MTTGIKKIFFHIFFLLLCLSSAITLFSQYSVTGTVKNTDGQPLEGVSVAEKGTNKGVITDANGKFSINVSGAKSVLVFTSTGYRSREIQAEKAVSVVMDVDLSEMDVVIVTAGRQPVRKLETITAVEIISSKSLKTIKPEGISEAINLAPGVYINQSQGRRGGIVTRGFPDGGNPLGGLDYTAILLDGIPSFGTTGRLPEAGFGFDLNVDRVEVVRGSTATLFGRASAAGAINVISKTGGERIGGSFRFTNYNNVFDENKQFNYRVDFNINGPITKDKSLRFSLGGWMINDNGFKNTGFQDKGYQFRGNLEYQDPDKKAKIRLYFLKADYVFQNLTDVPADPNTMKIAGGYKQHQTLQNYPALYNLKYTVYESGSGFPTRRVTTNGTDSIYRDIGEQMRRNSYGDNFHVGTMMNFKLPKGFEIEEHFRYQNLKSGTKYSFALPSYYFNNYVQRLLLDGDANDKDIINEIRLKKKLNTRNLGEHTFVLGHFISNMELLPTTYSFLHVMNPSNPNNYQWAALAPPFAPNPWSGPAAYPRGSITRRGDYLERVNGVFFGDEIKYKNKLTVVAGLRYDWVLLDMKERKRPFDSLYTRKEKHEDWSGSIGINYLFNQKTAIYANYTRAFRAPDYTAYTSLEPVSFTNRNYLRAPNGIPENEHVYNFEVGYRTTKGDFTFDIAGFHTKITNRLASIFQGGIVISVPFGTNRIVGTELSVSYFSSVVKGLTLRSNLTVQKPYFEKFKIPVGRGGVLGNTSTQLNVNPNGNLYGNKLISEGGGNYSIDLAGRRLPGVPSVIWNSTANYTHKYFGLDFSSNVNANRWVDPTQILRYRDLWILNAGAYLRMPFKSQREVRLGAQVKNLTGQNVIQNIAGLAASDLTLGNKQKFPGWVNTSNNVPIWGQGYVQLPRRWLIYLSVDF
ncbi:MAG: TonB-dependent receptor [Chitinophagaceae bacterium]|nr:TonB-dependent receptor [Chitinophagaceae bacterium]